MKTSEKASFYKKFLASLLTVGLALHVTGCTTSSSTDEATASGGDETFAEETEGDFADEGGGDSESTESTETAESNEPADDMGAEDDLSKEVADSKDQAEDDMKLDDEGDQAAVADGEDDLALDDEAGLPEDVAKNAAPAEPAPTDPKSAAPPTDAPVFAEQEPQAETTQAAAEPPPVDTSTETPAGSWVPVKKIKSSAFQSASSDAANLNRVYIARAGDTRQSVAEKIYGDKARSKDLLKWNSHLSRGMKTGDKVYYQSAANPTDANMLTYYEDAGVPAQTYTSKEGENIRAVSKTLLGSDESWKEVWATNFDVESKGDIPAGLNIRYWPEGSVAAPVLAANTPAVDPMAATTAPADPMAAPTDPTAAPPQVDPLAANTPPAAAPGEITDPLSPPPPADPLAAAPTATPASETSPPTDAAATAAVEPPPPPPPPANPAVAEAGANHNAAVDSGMEASGTEEADNMMMMGLAGIVLLAAGAVLVMVRRNKSRKVDLTQTTQVG